MQKTVYAFLVLSTWGYATAAVEVPKSDWIAGMSTALPVAFCRSEQFFRQCFRVSSQKCEEVASSATRVCLNRYASQMPNVLRQPQDGEKWGAIIGSCAGEAYQAALTKEFKDTTLCNDPKRWIGK